MIDEKKIEEAAEKYARFDAVGFQLENRGEEYYYQYNVEEAFKAGINWLLDNIKHDASKEPEDREKEILYINNSNFIGTLSSKYLRMYRKESWKNIVSCFDITCWLYIDDLLKGGSHE